MARYDIQTEATAAGFADTREAAAYLIEQGMSECDLYFGSDWIHANNRSIESRATRIFAHRAAEIAAQSAPVATETLASARQVEYILDLVAAHHRDGITAGFMSGPTARADIERMTRREASAYIDSLRESY